MRKRKLKRRLRECRETLNAAIERDPGAFGICMPVPSWRDREELGLPRGIRFETPGYAAAERARIEELEAQLATALDSEGTLSATVIRQAREMEQLACDLSDATRHIEHHHRNGAFTLVREVSEQVARQNAGLRESNDGLRGVNRSLAAKLDNAEAALEWHARVWCAEHEAGETPTARELVDAYLDQPDEA